MANAKRPIAVDRRERILSQILKGNTTTLPQKVAHILNQFPETRDSDKVLTIKLLQTFYPEFINEGRIRLEDLNILPKSYDMARHRARFQNDCGLFLASPEIQLLRKKNQNKEADDFRTNRLDVSTVFIFADESGKTGTFLILGSLWIYARQACIEVMSELNKWREKENWKSEFHFKKIKNIMMAENAANFFDVFLKYGSLSAFKTLILSNADFSSSDKLGSVYSGLAEMLIEGIETEIDTGRLSIPIRLDVVKDADPDSDVLQRAPMNRRIVEALSIKWKKRVALKDGKVRSVESERNDLVQIADLFTGSINRWINEGIKEKASNPKDWLADHIGSSLGWHFEANGHLQSKGDFCKIIYLK